MSAVSALLFWGSWPGTKHPGGLLTPRRLRMRISYVYTWISQRMLLYGMGMSKANTKSADLSERRACENIAAAFSASNLPTS